MIQISGSGEVTDPPPSADILAAQVFDWQPDESIADLGSSPDVLQIDIFS